MPAKRRKMQNLNILYKNLEEKYEVMSKINKMNINFIEDLKHVKIFKVESLDDFLNKKEKLIDDLELLEAKTSSYFEKIKNENINSDNIKDIKDMIGKIQELLNVLEEDEKYIKKQVEIFISNEMASLKFNKKTSVAAFNYYKTMKNLSNVAPQFFDVKSD